MPLYEIQQAFAESLLSEEQHHEYPGHTESCEKKTIHGHILSNGKLSTATRLNIYRNTSRLTWLHCLRDVYPACEMAMGETSFTRMALQYIQYYPADQGDVTFYGKHLPKYLQSNLQYLEESPYLAELARFEWTHYMAYYSADAPLWPHEEFASVYQQTTEPLYLSLTPDAQLIHSLWPLDSLKNHAQSKMQARDKLKLIEAKQDRYWIIYRRDFHGHAESLTAQEWQLLSDIVKPTPLAELISSHGSLCEALLPLFIQKRWICGFECGSIDGSQRGSHRE